MKLLKYVIMDICKPCRRFNKGQCLGPLAAWSSNVHEVTIGLHDMGFYMSLWMQSIPSISYLHPTLGVWFAISLYLRGSLTIWRSSSTKNKQRLVTEKKHANPETNLAIILWIGLIGKKNFHSSDLLTIHLLYHLKLWSGKCWLANHFMTFWPPLRCIIRNQNTQLIVFTEEILHQLNKFHQTFS